MDRGKPPPKKPPIRRGLPLPDKIIPLGSKGRPDQDPKPTPSLYSDRKREASAPLPSHVIPPKTKLVGLTPLGRAAPEISRSSSSAVLHKPGIKTIEEAPPTISFDEFNGDVFPREKGLPYNMNAGHGGAAAILLHTHQRQSTTQSQLSLIQSAFNSNSFNTKLISTSVVGIPAIKDNVPYSASISRDLQTNRDGDLIMKMRDGRHNVTLFSNQAIFTRGGRFPQRESSPEGTLVISLQELGFASIADAVEDTASFLIGCSTSRSDENTPVACCYQVDIWKSGDDWKLDAVPGGKCGFSEMTNKWKFDMNQDGGVKIEGPPESHFVFFCNRNYSGDVNEGSPCGKVFFAQTHNGELSTTLVPKIRTHYGRAMFLLCSRSNPDTNLVTSALYFVAPM
eukprot:XP_011660863.1 PREDICTED: uncharacterized protein LOC105436718 [Strongylocentrotus purpuratus]